MKRVATAAAAICAVVGLLNASSVPAASGAAGGSNLKLGILGGMAVTQDFAAQQCLMRALADGMKRPVEVIALASQKDLQNALIAGIVDLAALNTRAYSTLWRKDADAVQPVLAPIRRGGMKGYRAIALTLPETGLAGLDALKGREIGFADHRSLPGYFVPSVALERAGLRLERDAGAVQFSRGSDANLMALESGAIDAAVTWIAVPEQAGAPIAGPLARFKSGARESFVEIWRSALVPNGPIVLRKALPAPLKAELTAQLKQLGVNKPDCLAAAFGRPIIGLFEVEHGDYETFIAADRRRISRLVASN